MARPSTRTAAEKAAIYLLWMQSKSITQRAVAFGLRQMVEFPNPANQRQIKELIRHSPFREKSAMSHREFHEVKSELRRGLKQKRDLRLILQRCEEIRARHGWTPNAPNSARSMRKRRLEVSGYQTPKIAADITNVLEFLLTTSALNDPLPKEPDDQDRDRCHRSGGARREAASRLGSLFEGAQITPVASPQMEVGSSAFGSKTPSDHKLDCFNHLARAREGVPKDSWRVLERSIFLDEILWDQSNKKQILAQIRGGLDIVARNLDIPSRSDRKPKSDKQEPSQPAI
ncbi:MAG: hypothetical protein AAF468_20080 [Pseudomonadota bacterium]